MGEIENNPIFHGLSLDRRLAILTWNHSAGESALSPYLKVAASMTIAGPCSAPGNILDSLILIEVDFSCSFHGCQTWVDQSENPSLVTTQDRRGFPSQNSIPALTQVSGDTRAMMPAWSNCARGLRVNAVVRVA